MTAGASARHDLGVVVNPIAGMGGRVGLHGTDGSVLQDAVRLGARPVAPERAGRALSRLAELVPNAAVLTVAGPMGGDHLPAGWAADLLPAPTHAPTTAADTRDVVTALVQRGVSLVVFAGGDGTARDVAAVTGTGVPILGVPCGVKMQSGVFATGPEAAAEVAARHLLGAGRWVQAEVVDTEDGSTRMFGVVRVPRSAVGLQAAKAVPAVSATELSELGRAVAEDMDPSVLYLLGPGTTVGAVSAALGVAGSVQGIDAVLDGALIAADAGEAELLKLLRTHPRAALILGVVGGQGFLLGRGNAPLSPEVLAKVGPANIEVISAPGKIAALDPPVLRVDLDNAALREQLTGYRKVRTSRRRSTVLRVVA